MLTENLVLGISPRFPFVFLYLWANLACRLLCLCRSLCDIQQHRGTRYFRVCLHKDAGKYILFPCRMTFLLWPTDLKFTLIITLRLASCLQSFEKQGFHAGTPAASFSLPSALGSGGPINPPAAAGYAPAPFMHILAPHQQPHSQILHHHLQQDGQVA